jgi:hypothetical protein
MRLQLISSARRCVLTSHTHALSVGDRVYLPGTSVPFKCAFKLYSPKSRKLGA